MPIFNEGHADFGDFVTISERFKGAVEWYQDYQNPHSVHRKFKWLQILLV